MSGLKSRRKGLRVEYLIRDYFRGLGYTCNRVPSSGAAEGFKGDLEISGGSLPRPLLAEVKARRDDFKSIYAYYDLAGKGHSGLLLSRGDANVRISYNFAFMQFNEISPYGMFIKHDGSNRALTKLFNLKRFVKECDFLVIKIDHKPPLFVRFL